MYNFTFRSGNLTTSKIRSARSRTVGGKFFSRLISRQACLSHSGNASLVHGNNHSPLAKEGAPNKFPPLTKGGRGGVKFLQVGLSEIHQVMYNLTFRSGNLTSSKIRSAERNPTLFVFAQFCAYAWASRLIVPCLVFGGRCGGLAFEKFLCRLMYPIQFCS